MFRFIARHDEPGWQSTSPGDLHQAGQPSADLPSIVKQVDDRAISCLLHTRSLGSAILRRRRLRRLPLAHACSQRGGTWQALLGHEGWPLAVAQEPRQLQAAICMPGCTIAHCCTLVSQAWQPPVHMAV